MKLTRLLFVLGLTWLAAWAADPEAPAASDKPPTDFRSLDTDSDGRISIDEFTAPAVKHRAAIPPKPGEEGKAVDASKDGILSPADSIEGRYSPEVFMLLDVNHDKYVSPEELAALFTSAHNISQP
jgi:hypothetical protein